MKTKDITGQRFGKLVVCEPAIRPAHSKDTEKRWLCRCDCGRETTVRSYALRKGSTKSCGCIRADFIDMSGKRFGRLFIVGRGEDWKSMVGNKHIRWNWVCDCGATGRSTGAQLRAGRAKSCGCYKKDPMAAFNNVYNDYVGSARRRGLQFLLSRDTFRQLTTSNCHYCDLVPSTVEKKAALSNYTYNGIDRVDNEIGYVAGNCVPCCFPCNSAKGTMSSHDFFSLIRRIYNKHLVVRKSMSSGYIPA